MTSLWRITMRTPRGGAEEARAAFVALAPQGFEERDVEDGVELAVFVDGDTLETMRARLPGATVEPVEDGWEDAWRAFHRPVEVAGIWIGPPWEAPPIRPSAVVIDPGRAFGTGAHPTTRLCVELLAGLARRGSLLDVGCGSGVLGDRGSAARLRPGHVRRRRSGRGRDDRRERRGERRRGRGSRPRRADEPLPAADVAVANVLLGPVETILRGSMPRGDHVGLPRRASGPRHAGWPHAGAACSTGGRPTASDGRAERAGAVRTLSHMPRRRRLVAIAAVALFACVLIGSSTAASAAESRQRSARITLAGIREHLVALQRIAARNRGNRLAGTTGYDASARYVAQRMRAAGYRVRFQEFRFPLVVDRSPPVLRAAGTERFRPNRDFGTLLYSGSDAVEAPVVAVDLLLPSPSANTSTSGCESADFASFPRGSVALLQRGGCFFHEKVENAVAAGAGAVVVMNEGNPGRRALFQATLGAPQLAIPALAASVEVGDALRNGRSAGPTGVTVTLRADVIAETRRTRNVIAESRTGNAANLVVAGAHLDSVDRGPGLNDNGSGSALVLEVAESLAGSRPANRLRFVWWGGEELGLLGSRHYVSGLAGRAAPPRALPELRHGRLEELRPLRVRGIGRREGCATAGSAEISASSPGTSPRAANG